MSTPILLIEDNPGDVFLIRESLQRQNVDFDLQTVADGETAFEMIERAEELGLPFPTLVIVDLNVPKRSGDEILARIRQSKRLKETTVIVVTSSDAPADRERAFRLGADAYFRKPYSLDQFLQLGRVIRDMLSARQSEPHALGASIDPP